MVDRVKKDRVYMDNGASSFPKAPLVGEAILDYINNIGANVNRSSHSSAKNAGLVVYETRLMAKKLFAFPHSEEYVIFTPGATQSLNQAIKGYARSGMRILTGSLEHNAVMRPLRELESEGVKLSFIPCKADGTYEVDSLGESLRDQIDLIVISHASNVCGSILQVEELGRLARQKNIPFVLDASQSAGHIDVDFETLGLSALCVPGHKGLLGPQGIGLMLCSPEFADRLKPIVSGGTGSLSELEVQPDFLPDKFESGTPNIPGIFGLNRALEYILDKGIDSISETEKNLVTLFLRGLKKASAKLGGGFKIIGTDDLEKRLGVVSLDFVGNDNADIAAKLESEYGIMTRCGLHCAPQAHKSLGTFPEGTVRFSLGQFTTPCEIDYVIAAIVDLLS